MIYFKNTFSDKLLKSFYDIFSMGQNSSLKGNCNISNLN